MRVLCATLVFAAALALPARGQAPSEPVLPPSAAGSADRPVGLAHAVLHSRAVEWDSVSTGHLRLYFEPDGWAAGRVDSLRLETDAALRQSLRLLERQAFPFLLRVFVIDSRSDMQALVGRSAAGTAEASSNAVLLVGNERLAPQLRHEVMHAVSLQLWGHPFDPVTPTQARQGGWLREGIAMLAQGRCGAYPNRGVAAAMLQRGDLLPVDTLRQAFYDRHPGTAYVQSGALVEYLLDRYGTEALYRVWTDGPGAVPAVTGASADEVERGWHRWLRATPSRERPPRPRAAVRDGCVRRPVR
jgi:hypothetical protein